MPTPSPPQVPYAVAAASVLLATLARWLLNPALGDHFPFVTYFVALLFTAWYGGLGPAALAIALGALSAAYFFIPPRGSLALRGLDNQVGMALYLVVGAFSALLSEALQIARRRAEADAFAAAQSREWLRVTLDSVGDGVIATDPKGDVTFINPVAQSLTGWNESEAVGQPLEAVFDIRHEGSGEPVDNSVARVLREGTVVG